MGLDTSARAMVSRAVGAGDIGQANYIASQSLVFNTGLSVVMMAIGILLTEVLLRVLGVTESIVEEGAAYQRLRFASSVFFSLNMVSSSLLQAGGDTFTPMRAQVVARVIHIVTTPLLMFGVGPIPGLGISGAAISNGISQAAGGYMTLYALFVGSSRIKITIDSLKLDWRIIWRQIRIGAPASITAAERSLAEVVLVGLVAPFGTTGLAVFSIAQRVQWFSALGGMGLAQAAGVLVGQNLGARQPARARSSIWWALGLVVAIQGAICLFMFVFPEAVIFLFSREAEVFESGIPWIRISVIGFLVFGATNVLTLSLNTAGDTLTPMITGLGGIWGVQQPLAVVLSGAVLVWEVSDLHLAFPAALNIGLLGIALAVVIATVARFVALFLYFLWGPWWKKEVL